MNNRLLVELDNTIAPLIGFKNIGIKNIYCDTYGWDNFIPAKSLKPNHPLILKHYRGPLFIIIPTIDFSALLANEITVKEYVDNAYWHYGYFWGGNSILDGVYWQKLEKVPGIHDTKKIHDYFKILECRTSQRVSGHLPTKDECNNCSLDKCWYSMHKVNSQKIDEKDPRYDFLYALKLRIFSKLGFTVENCSTCYQLTTEDVVTIYPSYRENKVEVYLPNHILIDLLYNPEKYDIKKLASDMDLRVEAPAHFNENDEWILDKYMRVLENTTRNLCIQFWKDNYKHFLW